MIKSLLNTIFVPAYLEEQKPQRVVTHNQQELVRQIHRAFDEAQDNTILVATETLNKLPKCDEQRAEGLRKIGMTQAKEVIIANNIIGKRQHAERERDAVVKWRNKYPLYKFIPKETVTEICKKYGLICGEMNRYKGDIPEKNLIEIENFKIDQKDEIYIKLCERDENWRYVTYSKKIELEKQRLSLTTKDMSDHFYYSTIKCQYFICAPIHDLDTRGMEVDKNNMLIIKDDPIVLCRVEDGFLLVSKWGLEASDDKLINSVEN